jgi:O-antigen/teichoic acid export membrane protein
VTDSGDHREYNDNTVTDSFEETSRTKRRRMAWGLFDQVLSSATNFALIVVVARAVTPEAFGAFALAIGVYLASVGINQAFASEPLVVRFSDHGPEETGKAVGEAASAALFLGAFLGLATAATGLLLGNSLGRALFVTGLLLPSLLLHDVLRHGFFVLRRPRTAAALDAGWGGAQLITIIFATASGADAVELFLVLWGGSGALTAIVAARALRTRLRPGSGLRWLRVHRQIGLRFAGEYSTVSLAVQAVIYSTAISGNLAAAGALRAAESMYGPVNMAFSGVRTAVVPEAVRLAGAPRRLMKLCLSVSAAITFAATTWAVVIWLTPAEIGGVVLGDTWALAAVVAVPIGAQKVAQALSTGPLIAARARADARTSFRIRVILALLIVVLGVPGSILAGALGAAWALAIATTLATILWWASLMLAPWRRRETVATLADIHLTRPE